jgi:hypothetical protein
VEYVPRVLIGFGIVLVIAGLLFWAGQAIGLGRLPGDIVVERPHVRIAVPLATSLVISVLLTIILNVAIRLWR